MSNQEIRYLIKNEIQYLKFKNPKNLHIYKIIYNKYKNIIESEIKFETYSNREKIYCYINNIKERPKCQYCKINVVNFDYFDAGYRKYCCKSCIGKGTINKKIQTCLKNYGVENPSQSKYILQKKVDTCIKRYSCNNAQQNIKIREKTQKTNLERYGVESPGQNDKVKEKMRQTNLERYGVENPSQNEKIKQKKIKTCLENYGVEHPFQAESIKDKKVKTNLERYGYDYASKNDKVKEKMRQTNLERYGCDYYLQTSELKEKTKLIMLERYNVKNCSQSSIIQSKKQRTSYKSKNYILPSNNIIKVQGYEPYALDILLYEMSYNEEDILTSVVDMPKIFYYFENKKHRYFCDIFIPKENRLIEIKSTYTFEKEVEKNMLKQKAAKDMGYIHEIWIIDKKKIINII
jgi:hypothetical protein